MKFYNLKVKAKVEVPDSECVKVIFNKGTNKERYAFRAVTATGDKLMKFCNKADYDASPIRAE